MFVVLRSVLAAGKFRLATGIASLTCLVVPWLASIGMAQSSSTGEISMDEEIRKRYPDLPPITKPNGPVALKYQLKPGDTFTFRFSSTENIDVMGLEMPKMDRASVRFVIDSVDSDGSFVFTSQIVDMVSEMSSRGGSYRIDTENPKQAKADPAFRPLVTIWKDVLKQELSCRCSAQGEILDFKVPKGIKDAVENRNNPYGIEARDLCAFFLSGLTVLPEQPVSVGEKWNVPMTILPLGAENAEQTATFMGVTKSKGTKLAAYQVELAIDVEDGTAPLIELEVRSKSLVLFDLDRGNVWSTHNISNSEMVLQVGDNDILQIAKGKSEIKRIKRP